MTETDSRARGHRKLLIAGTSLATLALVGWGVLHPDFRPNPKTISPAMLEEFARTGFKPTRGIRAARFETSQSVDAATETVASEQRIVPLDELLTEKRTVRRTVGSPEEAIGLYLGPFSVVRFYRTKMPVIGDLLPSYFWSSSRMTKFVIQQVDSFPGTKGGILRAKVTYEDRYADGQLFQTEDRLLQCQVANIVDAATALPGLSGPVARIECYEELEAAGRKAGPTNPQTWSQGRVAYTHWYMLENHWSIPSEGEMAIRLQGRDTIRKWKTKLISFERNN